MVAPALLRGCNVLFLSLLGPAAQQENEDSAIPAEIDTVARSEMDFQLHHARTHWFYISNVAFAESQERSGDSGDCGTIHAAQPAAVGNGT
jgi:hypothetical protein